MLRKICAAALTAALLLLPVAPAGHAGYEIYTDPVQTETEFADVTATYSEESDRTTYRLQLKNDPVFPDGTPVTAEDLLFSYYVALDPGASGDALPDDIAIVGAYSYQLQIPEATLESLNHLLIAIPFAGRDHVWSESDAWTEAQQDAWWALWDAYLAACAAEFPNCAQAIVNSAATQLAQSDVGAFGRTAEEIAESEGLQVAYAMYRWGYASYDETRGLIARHSRTVWSMDDLNVPTVEDFASELSQAYGGDLRRCWMVEGVDDYVPDLPDPESEFLIAFAGATEPVTSISGIRLIDETTIEIDLEGVDMDSAAQLFGIEILSVSAHADPALWAPESGSYGHPFGDVSAIVPTASIHLFTQSPYPTFG